MVRFSILYDSVEETVLGVSVEKTAEGAKRKFANSLKNFFRENHEKMGDAECLTFLSGLRLYLGTEFEEAAVPEVFGPESAAGYDVVTSPAFVKKEATE